MTQQTHLQCKSIGSDVPNIEKIQRVLKKALTHQEKFEKGMLPWEEKKIKNWREVQKFKIDLEQIDRLYYFNQTKDEYAELYFQMKARVINNEGKHFYFDLTYSHNCIHGCCYYNSGNVFFTADVNYFMRIFAPKNKKKLISQSLKEDGIKLQSKLDNEKLEQAYTHVRNFRWILWEKNRKEKEQERIRVLKDQIKRGLFLPKD